MRTSEPIGLRQNNGRYAIVAQIELAYPLVMSDLNDDFQQVRLLEQSPNRTVVEVTCYPMAHAKGVSAPSEPAEDEPPRQYLEPGAAENWDQAMRKALVSDLLEDGIDVRTLGKSEIVQKVSYWALRRVRSVNTFVVWSVYFPDAKPSIFPSLADWFNAQVSTSGTTARTLLDQEVLGKSMYYGQVHGDCTSVAVYLSTILRALRIPTRMVACNFAVPRAFLVTIAGGRIVAARVICPLLNRRYPSG